MPSMCKTDGSSTHSFAGREVEAWPLWDPELCLNVLSCWWEVGEWMLLRSLSGSSRDACARLHDLIGVQLCCWNLHGHTRCEAA